METSLKISNISKAYPDCLANDNINLELKSGKIYALLGENGAGKSTLVKILFGIIQPDKGKIFLNNQILKLNSPRDAKKNKISMVFQHFSLFETLSVLENLILDSSEPKKSLENKIQDIINKYNFCSTKILFNEIWIYPLIRKIIKISYNFIYKFIIVFIKRVICLKNIQIFTNLRFGILLLC